MTKLSLKSKYTSGENKVITTLGAWVDDVKLKATFSDRTVRSGSLQEIHGVELGVERPGHFMIDYELEKKVIRYQFHSSAEVFGKNVKLTLNHHHGRPTTTLEAAVGLDYRNKVVVKQILQKTKPHVKFEHVYDGKTTLEPSYDFATDTWGVAMKQKVSNGHIKVAYSDLTKRAELELHTPIGKSGPLKVVVSAPVNSSGKGPIFSFEKEWLF